LPTAGDRLFAIFPSEHEYQAWFQFINVPDPTKENTCEMGNNMSAQCGDTGQTISDIMPIENASAKRHHSFLGHLKQRFTDQSHVVARFKPDSGSLRQIGAGRSNDPNTSLFAGSIFRRLIAAKTCIHYMWAFALLNTLFS
jgi:hypothetical protein